MPWTIQQTLQTSQNLKQAHKGEGLPSPYPLPTGPGRSVANFPGGSVASLTFKICRKNENKLLLGPFGSDQSRHVDDFGAKKHNFDDFAANTRRLFDEKMGYGHLFIDGRIYL